MDIVGEQARIVGDLVRVAGDPGRVVVGQEMAVVGQMMAVESQVIVSFPDVDHLTENIKQAQLLTPNLHWWVPKHYTAMVPH